MSKGKYIRKFLNLRQEEIDLVDRVRGLYGKGSFSNTVRWLLQEITTKKLFDYNAIAWGLEREAKLNGLPDGKRFFKDGLIHWPDVTDEQRVLYPRQYSDHIRLMEQNI